MDDSEIAPPPDPDRRLGEAAPIAWFSSGVIATIAIGLATGAVVPVVDEVDGMPSYVAPLLIVAAVTAAVLLVAVRPRLLWRTWRYAVREDEIDLRTGWVVRTRTIIPMTRVQHVDTERSWLAGLFELQTLNIHTAAGAHEIPFLPAAVADNLRTEIARRAHVPDEL